MTSKKKDPKPLPRIFGREVTAEEAETYISADLNPLDVRAAIQALLEASGEEGDADIDLLIFNIFEVATWARDVLIPAVKGLIEVHQDTGIDLKHWEPVLRLVQSVDVKFSIAGEEEW